MEPCVVHSYCRKAVVVTPSTTTTYPAGVTSVNADANAPFAVIPAGSESTGLYNAMAQWNPQTAVDAGVPKTVSLIPFATSSTTWTITVYGLRLIGSVWHAVHLFSGSAACTTAVVDGDETSDSVDNDWFRITTFTTSGTYPADDVRLTNAVGGHVELATKGCPFLWITTSDGAGRVAVAPVD